MRIIKCDMCGKPIEKGEFLETLTFGNGPTIDMCRQCHFNVIHLISMNPEPLGKELSEYCSYMTCDHMEHQITVEDILRGS